MLEVTLTQAVMDSYQATQAVISDVALVNAEPFQLETIIFETVAGLSPGGETLYWLQNLTDMPVEFWSEQPGHGYRSLAIANDPADLGEPWMSLLPKQTVYRH